MRLASIDDLRQVYRPPGRGPVDKVIHRLDPHCVDFLANSPFFVLSTANVDGVCDGSPKGGPAGFVQVLDDGRLAWADFSGNNRLDSFQNLVLNDSVALLFLIPGLDETLRVNGTAELVTDPDLCQRFAVGVKTARVVVVVTVVEVYIHCAKALRRAPACGRLTPGSIVQTCRRRPASSRTTLASMLTSPPSRRPANAACRAPCGSLAAPTAWTYRQGRGGRRRPRHQRSVVPHSRFEPSGGEPIARRTRDPVTPPALLT